MDAPDSNSDATYADDNPVVQTLGTEGKVRILVALEGVETGLADAEDTLPKKEIARLAGVAPSTVGRHIDELIERGLVESAGYRRSMEHYALADTPNGEAFRQFCAAQYSAEMDRRSEE